MVILHKQQDEGEKHWKIEEERETWKPMKKRRGWSIDRRTIRGWERLLDNTLREFLMSYCFKETQVSTGPGPGNWLAELAWKQICHVLGQLVLLLGLPSLVHWVVRLAPLCGTFEMTFLLACQPCGSLSLFRISFIWGGGSQHSSVDCFSKHLLTVHVLSTCRFTAFISVQYHLLNYLWGSGKPVPIFIINASHSPGGHVY